LNSNEIDIEAFLLSRKNIPVIDVRSPSEFIHGHVPSALNVPLFSDSERARVGIIYKQSGVNDAVLEGLKYAGPKLVHICEQASQISRNQEIIVYCQRGGMRSGSVAWLLKTAGFKVFILKGGYKSYRKKVLDSFSNIFRFIIIGGKTGTGKTEFLKLLSEKGEQVLDIEEIAHHRGSVFGQIAGIEQDSNEYFENNLFEKLHSFDILKNVWIEDESRVIGKNILPIEMYNKMKRSPVIVLDLEKEKRVKHLVNMYSSCGKTFLSESLNKISKRIGKLMHQKALEALYKDDFETVASLALHYYDKAYDKLLDEKKEMIKGRFRINSVSDNESVEKIIEFVNSEKDLWKI